MPEPLPLPDGMPHHLAKVFSTLRIRHPAFYAGALEAWRAESTLLASSGEKILGWLCAAYGADAAVELTRSYTIFASDTIKAQLRYEAEGCYQHARHADVADLYRNESMHDYLWGLALANLLWGHHLESMRLFLDRFLPLLPVTAHIAELAPGHGTWGLLALDTLSEASLEAVDLSPTALEIQSKLANVAGLGARSIRREGDALAPDAFGCIGRADACISCLLIEHLEDPGRLPRAIAALLRPGGHVFLTAALSAAQEDHLHEFRDESEPIRLCEEAGLRLLDARSAGAVRLRPGARFRPRVLSLILRKAEKGAPA